MNRRSFLVNTAILSVSLPFIGFAKDTSKTITILHTNDTHSRIDPFPDDGRLYGGLGGVARRAALIAAIRKTTDNVLLLDAGDVFQGTPYFNYFGGELDYKLMSAMKYDATTLGNHDFDAGLAGLKKQLPYAKFPHLIANYSFEQTPLAGAFIPHKIFTKNQIKIGVFGLGIEMNGLVSKNLFQQTTYLEPLQVAQEQVKMLRKQGTHLIICLSHLGFEYPTQKVSDKKLADQVSGIDIIIGGHTHTFLEKPFLHTRSDDSVCVINQVGWAGINLGKIDVIFSKNHKTISGFETAVIPVSGNPFSI